MSTTINSVMGTTAENIPIDGQMSLSFAFARLQMIQAENAKTQATEYMKQIEDIQAKQKEAAEMIEAARKLQNEAKSGNKNTTMPQNMIDFCKANNISIESSGKDNKHSKDEWEYNLKGMTNYQEQLGNKTQTLMVYLQEFIGQYNTYTQGAASAIDKGNQALQSILR